MFHVEVRQFPHVARVFNLSREELDEKIVRPWAGHALVELDERQWVPERARLKIYEGRELRSDELGLGRGWSNATRTGEEVTARVMAETQAGPKSASAIAGFKLETVRLCAVEPVALGQLVELAGEHHPQWRASERLALVEQAVWELLHQGHLRMIRAGEPADSAGWQPALFSWGAWTGAAADSPLLEASSGEPFAPAGPAS